MHADFPNYRYRVDQDDVLVWVDAWWLAFARENGAPQLREALVLGRSLWDFMADPGTRAWYRELHRRVREQGKRVTIPFRCDSPSIRRYMQAVITPDDCGHLSYACTMLKAEPRPPARLLDVQQRRSQAFLTMCSFCKRSLLESIGWLEVEDVVARARLSERSELPQVHYAVCPDCAAAVGSAVGDTGGDIDLDPHRDAGSGGPRVEEDEE